MSSVNLPEVNGVEHRDSIDSSIGELSEGHIVLEPVEKKRVPKRILHFSDGTLEEYSTDEDDIVNLNAIKRTTVSEVTAVNPKVLPWSSWFWYQTVLVSTKTLSACDFLGEKLAKFFGITTPKYEYEIDFYNTMKAEEEEQKKREDLEMGGWSNPSQHSGDVAVIQNGTVTSPSELTPPNERSNEVAWTHSAKIGTSV